MKTVSDMARLTGVSVRALHHYDAVGLLKPAKVSEAGYRLYDDESLKRLSSILFFRELGFSLKEIGRILDDPAFSPADALASRIDLMELERDRLDRLIACARELQEKGALPVNYDVFDKNTIEQYKEEAKERWGATDAYREYERRGETCDQAGRIMALFAGLGAMKHLPPEDGAVQQKVDDLRAFITEHFYTCTKEILACLGQMYTGDERFRRNIDRAGGEGTAAFAGKAIGVYCEKE